MLFWFWGSVEKVLAVDSFDRVAPCLVAGVLAHCRIGCGGIHMGHLFPVISRRPAHRVPHCVVFGYMEPEKAAALGIEQFLEPLVAQHENRIGIDDQLRFFCIHASLF